MSNCIVIPAAGASRRLGRPKQLVEFEGKTLIRRSVETALEVSPDVVVVIGFEGDAVRVELEDLPVFLVKNPDWEAGLGTSISTGVRAAIDRFMNLTGVLIHLCDMPFVGSDHLKEIIGLGENGVVFTSYSDTSGVPAFFGEDCFEDLLFLDGDRGAKGVIESAARKSAVKFEGEYLDIDTPEDLERL